MTELDKTVLYELLQCCKVTMNNEIGMNGFLNTARAVERVAQSLIIDAKPIALQVITITITIILLSICCATSVGSQCLM